MSYEGSTAFRVLIGDRLRSARETRRLSVRAVGAAGVDRQTVERLEWGLLARLPLSTVYLLALHYRVSFRRLLDEGGGDPYTLGRWGAGTPSLVETDQGMRRGLRAARATRGWGTPRAAAEAAQIEPTVYQNWIARVERGHVELDLVRARACALAYGTSLSSLIPRRKSGPEDRARSGDHHPSDAGAAPGPSPAVGGPDTPPDAGR